MQGICKCLYHVIISNDDNNNNNINNNNKEASTGRVCAQKLIFSSESNHFSRALVPKKRECN